MSDAYCEISVYWQLYVVCGGLLALHIALYRLLRPKYYGLLLFCGAFIALAFGVVTATAAAHSIFSALGRLTAAQEEIRFRLLAHISLVGFAVPVLASALACESLRDFLKASKNSVATS